MKIGKIVRKFPFIVIVAVFGLIIGPVINAYYFSERKATKANKYNTLKTILDFKCYQISAWYSDEVHDVEVISKDPALRNLIQSYQSQKSDLTENNIVHYLNQIQTEHVYADIILFYPDGEQMTSADQNLQEFDSISRHVLIEALSTKKNINTDLYRSNVYHKVFMDFILPLYDEKNVLTGGILFRKDPETFFNPMLKLWPSEEKTAETYVIKKTPGNKFFSYKVGRFTEDFSCWFPVTLTDPMRLFETNDSEGLMETKDEANQEVLLGIRPIPGTPWSLVVKADRKELFKDLTSRMWTSFMVGFLLLMICIFLGIYLYSIRKERETKNLLEKEMELRRFQDYFKISMDILGEGIVTTDASGKIRYMNQRAEVMLEGVLTDVQSATLETLLKVTDENDVPLPFDLEQLKINKGCPIPFRRCLVHVSNGRTIPMEIMITPHYEESHLFAGLIISMHDETENRRQERLILESENRFRSLFESNPLPMWVYDVETLEFLAVNKAAVTKYGYSQDEFLHMQVLVLIPEEDRLTFQEMAEPGSEFLVETTLRHRLKNGQIIFSERASHNLTYLSRKARLVLANDVTKNREYESQLIEAKEKAEEGERLKSAFLANMSHEIRTPLNSIIGFSGILSDSDIQDSDVKCYAGYIEDSGNRLMELLDNVVRVSRIESGVEELCLLKFHLNDFLRSVFNQFHLQAKSIGLEYRLVLPEGLEPFEIEADNLKLGQILTNFLSNALKFTTEGSIEMGYVLLDRSMDIYVKDSGKGINPEHQNRIFERFYQADQSISRGYEGAGLGLAICKGFADLMGATIHLESQCEKGSTFHLLLPL
jgi:PAS domain S-box-containing protein